MSRSRFPRSVFQVGEEPDARFTLANERTFLAWNRTALALIAGGVALEAFGLDLQEGFRLAASLVLIVAGIALPISAWWEWMRAERALRTAQPLPGAHTSALLVLVVSAVGVLVLAGLLLR
jgi:putative membrane protein